MNEQELSKSQELAAFTDALLEGRMGEGDKRPPLADIVEIMARTIGPQPLPDDLRREVKRRIATEWSRRSPPVRRQPSWTLRKRHWIWATAAALILIAAIASLLTPLVPGGNSELVGAATGRVGGIVLIITAVLTAVAAIYWLASRRR